MKLSDMIALEKPPKQKQNRGNYRLMLFPIMLTPIIFIFQKNKWKYQFN